MAQQYSRHDPIFDIHPRTGVSIEVFYADRAFGDVRQVRFWLVLVASPAGLRGTRSRYRPFSHELRSISPRLGDRFGDRV
jgi:hypothetical protein